jgi:hypothetical protein
VDDGQVVTADLFGRDLFVCSVSNGQGGSQTLGPGDGLPSLSLNPPAGFGWWLNGISGRLM